MLPGRDSILVRKFSAAEFQQVRQTSPLPAGGRSSIIADALLQFELRICDVEAQDNPYDEHIRSDALRAAENGLYVELVIRERIWSPVKPSISVQQARSAVPWGPSSMS